MEFDNAFDVPLPPKQAWRVLMDIERIAPCMPGAELTARVDDRSYKGKVGVRLGPVALSFAGTATFEDIDDLAHTARVKAAGTDAKGRGGANAIVTFGLEPAGQGSRVLIHTNLTLSGSVAQYGRGAGMIQEVAAQLIRQFATNLHAMIDAEPKPEVVEAAAPEKPPVPPAPLPPAKPISGFALICNTMLTLLSRTMLETYTNAGFWADDTIYALAARHAQTTPDAPAVRDRIGPVSYRDLVSAADELARDMAARGVRIGQRVAVWLPSRVETAVALLACSRNGYVCCLSLHRDHTVADVLALCERMRAAILIAQPGYGADAARANVFAGAPTVASLRHVYRLGDSRGFEVDPASPDCAANTDPNRIIYLPFTSGTTGQPKGVMHSDNTLLANARVMAEDWAFGPHSVTYTMSPLSHNLGLGALITSIVAGGELVVHDLARGASLYDRLVTTGATFLFGVPTHAIDLLSELRARNAERLGHVTGFRISGAAATAEVIAALMRYGVTPQSGYGMTETCSHQYTLPTDDPDMIASTCGRACPGYEVKIWSQENPDIEAAIGQVGQIGGRGASLMLGYFDDQQTTEASFNALAMRHTAIDKVAAFPVPDNRLGEKVCLAIVPRPGATIDDAALLAHLDAEGLSRYDMPEYLLTLDALPMTASGKIVKRDLQELVKDGVLHPHPRLMRAALVRRFGAIEDVVLGEVPAPVPAADEVLVTVQAAPVNFVDLLVVGGTYQFLPPLPFIPGKGPAGVVAACGAEVKGLLPGDAVLAMAEQGGYAEQVCVKAHQVYKRPPALSAIEAASMSLAYDTAWMALRERGRLAKDEVVLVLGASGAVGIAAVQLAKAMGARVLAAIARPERGAAMLEAGADAVIDLSAPNLRDALRDQVKAATGGKLADVVIDPIGGDAFDAALRALDWCGRLVVVGFAAGRIPSVKANYLLVKNIEVSGLQISDYRKRRPALMAECFAEIFAFHEQGRLHPPGVITLPLAEAAKGLAMTTMTVRGGFLMSLLAAACLAQPITARAADPVEIPVVLPLTGGAAFLGQGERKALEIAEAVANAEASPIKIHFTFRDDQSSPQVAVQLANQIKALNPPVVIGSAIVAMCNAMAPVLADGPVMYCLSPGIHPAAGSRVFTSFISTHDLARVLVRYYRLRGFTKIAMITSTDASGQDGRLGFEEAIKLPENAGMSYSASVQFNPTDVSVAAQVQQMKSSNPQAVVVWTSGAPMGTVLKGIVQGGLDVPVGTTDANMTFAQMQQYASFMPTEMLFMSSEWPPHGSEVTLDPKVVAAQAPMFAAYKVANISPDIAAALAWDPAILTIQALRNAGPNATAEQVRAGIAGVKGQGGINGIYDFTAVPQRGLDENASVVTRCPAMIRASALALLAASFIPLAARAQPAFEIPVVLPLSGSAAFLGQSERRSLEIAEKSINAEGGINGAPLHFAFNDDQSSPQVAVQLANQIKAKSPPIVLGSAIVAMCNAMAPVMADGPVTYCFSPGIHPEPGSRIFSAFISTHDLVPALVRYYRGRGFTRLGLITSTDASGQDGRLAFEDAMKLPENAGVKLTAAVQFNPSDVSVAAQVQQLKGSGAEAVVAWTSGAPMGTVLKGLVQAGMDVPVGTTDANMTTAQMQQYAAFMPTEMLFMSTQWPPHGAEITLDPRVTAAQTPMFAAYAAAGVTPDIALAHAWDPAMLAAAALRKLGTSATAEQVRVYLSGIKSWGGVNGVYDFEKTPQRGLDETGAVVTRWQPAQKIWTIVSKPGANPL
eukprot:gene2167-2204_t